MTLQKKIYYHARKNEIELIRHYPHKFVKSMKTRDLSVRQVSKNNRGKVLSGIYGISKLTSEQRLESTFKVLDQIIAQLIQNRVLLDNQENPRIKILRNLFKK